tara:strand:- start:677 stop:1336 length:660 start_codon:yes stop_codon:yes gene_type:complete
MATINLDTSQVLDIACKRGDTFSMTINLKDSSGTALTLSTDKYEFIMQVKPTNSTRDTDIILTTKNAVGFEIVKPTKTGSLGKPDLGDIGPFFEDPTVDDSGNVTIEASPEVMGQVPPGRYEYDIQYILPSSTGLDTHRTILFGAFSVIDDISRKVRKPRPPGGGGYNGGGYNGGGYNGGRPRTPVENNGNDTSFPPRALTPIKPRRRGRYNNQNNLLR